MGGSTQRIADEIARIRDTGVQQVLLNTPELLNSLGVFALTISLGITKVQRVTYFRNKSSKAGLSRVWGYHAWVAEEP